MSSDGGVPRPRHVPRPLLPPGPLADLKDALYELYLAASPMTLERIRERIEELAQGHEVSDPTASKLSRETIRSILGDPTLPADLAKLTAVAAALVHAHPLPGKVPVVRGHATIDHVRALWARAAAVQPLGRLLAAVDATALEVHPASPGHDVGEGSLPAYICRPHDEALDDLVGSALGVSKRSGMAVLISDSTSGKTRALYEALYRPVSTGAASSSRGDQKTSLAEAGWRIWPTISPVQPQEFLDGLDAVSPCTVIWLNEAQRYLIESDCATAIAGRLRTLLADPTRAPVLVLGTLWPLYLNEITRRSLHGTPDRLADARALLIGCTVRVPNAFSGTDLEAARASTDTRIQDALRMLDSTGIDSRRTDRVPLTQFIAGVPALMDFRANASTTVAAVLHAAMDVRRLGHGEWIPVKFLHHAAASYLTCAERREHLSDPNWFADALEALTAPLAAAGTRALHRPPFLPGQASDDAVRLEDHLDQDGRRTRGRVCPGQEFWDAVALHLRSGEDLHALAKAAHDRHRLQIAEQLYELAIAAGASRASLDLIAFWTMKHEMDRAEEVARRAEDPSGVELVQTVRALLNEPSPFPGRRSPTWERHLRITVLPDSGVPGSLTLLTASGSIDCQPGTIPEVVLADADANAAAQRLVHLISDPEGHHEAEQLALSAAAAGSPDALCVLSKFRSCLGDSTWSHRLALEAANAGHRDSFGYLTRPFSQQDDMRQHLLRFGLKADGTISPPW